MIRYRFVPALLFFLPLLGGCKRAGQDEPHHVGAKVNISDFIRNTAAYRGKALMLSLRVDEPIARAQGQSLRNYVGRDVRFTTVGPSGEQLDLAVRIPDGLHVPEVGNSDEVLVTFVCTRGSLHDGNWARAIQSP